MSTLVRDNKTGKIYTIPAGEIDYEAGIESQRIQEKKYLMDNNPEFASTNGSPEELLQLEKKNQAEQRLRTPLFELKTGFTPPSDPLFGPSFTTKVGTAGSPKKLVNVYKNSGFTAKQDMATVLNVPEAKIDLESGAPTILRQISAFYTNPNNKKSFYEKNTGAEYTNLNINGSPQAFLKYPDGKSVKVDEIGFGGNDFFEEVLSEILPVSADLSVQIPILLTDPTKFGSIAVASGAGAVAYTATKEAQAAYMNYFPSVLGLEIPDQEFNLADFGTRVTTEVVINGALDIVTGTSGQILVKNLPTTGSNQIYDETIVAGLESNKRYNKDLSQDGKPLVSNIKMTPENIEVLAAQKKVVNEEIIERQKTLTKRIYEIARAGDQSPEVIKKLVQESVESYVNKKRALIGSLAEEFQEINKDAADQLLKYVEEKATQLINDYGTGNYKLTGALLSNKNTIFNVLGSAGRGIKKQNDENYKNIYEVAKAQDKPIRIPLNEIVDAITGKTRTGPQSRLPEKQVDTLIETLFASSLKFKGRGYKTLKELQEAIDNKKIDLNEFDISFEDLDSFYKNQKKAFGTLMSSSDRNTRLAEDRIRRLRLKSIKGTEAHEALKEADRYFMDYHQSMYGPRGLLTEFADADGPLKGTAGFKNIMPDGDVLSPIESLQTAKRILSPTEYINYQDSLKLFFLDNYGFYGKISDNLFDKQTKELAEELFGARTEKIYDLAKDMRKKGLKLSKSDIDEYIAEMSSEGSALMKKRKLDQAIAEKKAENELATTLFSLESGKKAMIKDLDLAARNTNNPNVDAEKVKDFMLNMEGKETYQLAYRTEVLSDLINNVGNSGSSKSFFEADPIIELVKRFPEKYEAIFGKQELKKMLNALDYAKSIQVDVAKYNKRVQSSVSSVGKTAIGGSGGSLQISFSLLNYINPSAWKRGIGNKLMAAAILDGEFDKMFTKYLNPDFKYESERAMGEWLKKFITSEKWTGVFLGQDDYMSSYALEYLGMQSILSQENSSVLSEFKKEKEMNKVLQGRIQGTIGGQEIDTGF